MEAKNPFYERIKNYIGKEVTVILKSGDELKGKLVSVNFSTMNFIIENKKENEDYVVRDDLSYMVI